MKTALPWKFSTSSPTEPAGFALKTLVAEYLRLRYGAAIPRSAEILDCSQPQGRRNGGQLLKYARSVSRSRKGSVAYRITGTPEGPHYMNITTGLLPAQAVIDQARAAAFPSTIF